LTIRYFSNAWKFSTTAQAFDFFIFGVRLAIAKAFCLYSAQNNSLNLTRCFMSFDDDRKHDPLQVVVLPTANNTMDTRDDDDIDGLTDLDPLGDRVWLIVSDLLKSKNEITVQDVFEASDIKESPIRTRLSLLVRLKYLASVVGTGRRPTYYFLPQDHEGVELASPEYVLKTLKNSLVLKEQEEKRLLAELQAVTADKAAIERTIKILSNVGV